MDRPPKKIRRGCSSSTGPTPACCVKERAITPFMFITEMIPEGADENCEEVQLLDLFLRNGASVNVADTDGNTALHYAVYYYPGWLLCGY
jgi:ankyrin repeat protein